MGRGGDMCMCANLEGQYHDESMSAPVDDVRRGTPTLCRHGVQPLPSIFVARWLASSILVLLESAWSERKRGGKTGISLLVLAEYAAYYYNTFIFHVRQETLVTSIIKRQQRRKSSLTKACLVQTRRTFTQEVVKL